MIIKSGNQIRLLDQDVIVDGSRDDRFWCSSIRLGSHSGITEAEFMIPELYFDEFKDNMRDAFVRVEADGGSDTHFAGYLAVDSGHMEPNSDGVTVRAYTITKWLHRYHVGQFQNVWEVVYPVVDPKTKLLTGWTPALILQHLFAQLPADIQKKIKIGDVRVLADIAELTAPEVTFRLTDYATAINQVIGLLGDVAFRERFENDTTYLDFYRINEPGGPRAVVECAEWSAPGRANIQSLRTTDDGSAVVSRVMGYGAYRQFMITCRNAVTGYDGISELEAARQLRPYWNADLEPLVLLSPSLAKGGRGYSGLAMVPVSAGALAFFIKVDLNFVPVGSVLTVKSTGERLLVTGFLPATVDDPDALPIPIIAAPAVVSVTRGYKDTTAAAIPIDDVLDIHIPGIEHVFRRYWLPVALNDCQIMRSGCLESTDGNPYPMHQAFVYGAIQVKITDPDGKEWIAGVIPPAYPSLARDVKFDVERKTVTFGNPTLTLLEKRESTDVTKKDMVSTYQRAVCGVTFTVENKQWPFFHDTGFAEGITNFDFDKVGLTERWQKNELHSWRLGTMDMPINGVSFPCMVFPIETIIDPVTEEVTAKEGEGVFYPAGTGLITKTDYFSLRGLCEQILRERNRRARSFNIQIPWFSPGYLVGQDIEIKGPRNMARDKYKITSVDHSMPITGQHQTTLQIDNVKPPVRQKTRVYR